MTETQIKPLRERSSEELLEGLVTGLRHVGDGDHELPRGELVTAHVRQVRAIHAELAGRGVDWRPQLEQLGAETRWQVDMLLEDCLAFPERIPYVRESDGIRRALRCRLCGKTERPADAKVFSFCDECLRRGIEAIRLRAPCPGIILFRTYNPESRCPHANEDTVLAGENYIEELSGVCEKCLRDELERRRGISPCDSSWAQIDTHCPGRG